MRWTARERRRELRRRGAGIRRPRERSRAIVLGAIQQIPAFARLLIGLFRDRSVSAMDKLVVAGALAYLAMPADMLPDFLPFTGLVDDVFLLAAAVRRLIRNAGFNRAIKYWDGDPEDLRVLRIGSIITAASLFLPRRIRRRLRRKV